MRRADSLEKTLMLGKIEGRRRRGRRRMRWLGGVTDSMDMSLSKLRELVMDRRAAVHTVTKSQTGLSNWTELLIIIVREIKLASMTCNQTIHKTTILLDFRDLKTTIFIQTVNRHLKRCSTSLILETYKSKLQWGATSHWSEQPSSKSLQATNAGEGVEKREPSYPTGGNVSWCHNYGKGYGGSLEN